MNFAPPNPFLELLGFELMAFDAGRAEIGVTLRDELTNAWGVAHGGVVMTLLDTAMAHAARSPNQPAGSAAPGVATIDLKTMFMRPGSGRLTARGQVLHRTASMAFCEASIFDAGSLLVAHGVGMFKYLRGLPTGDRTARRSVSNA